MIINNNLKRFLFIFCYCLLVIILTIHGKEFQQYLKKQIVINYNPVPYLIFSAIFPFLIGIIIGLPIFIKRFISNGKWKIDWIQVLSIGLPSLYVTISSFIFLTPLGSQMPFIEVLAKNEVLNITGGIVLGFTIIYSIER